MRDSLVEILGNDISPIIAGVNVRVVELMSARPTATDKNACNNALLCVRSISIIPTCSHYTNQLLYVYI